jgi:Ca2+-binding RTX toxin-like protein
MLMMFAGLMGLVMIGSLVDVSSGEGAGEAAADDDALPEAAPATGTGDLVTGEDEDTSWDDIDTAPPIDGDAAPAPDGLAYAGSDDDDVAFGSEGADDLDGGAGHDALDGAEGDDRLAGGAGEDTLSGGMGADRLAGGADDDTLVGGMGDDTLSGATGDDVLRGWDDDDILDGGAGADTLMGGRGDDSLSGLDDGSPAARDFLNGGDGDDMLTLGAGDYATGGTGTDSFLLGDWPDFPDLAGASAPAVIADYDRAADAICVVYDPAAHPDPDLAFVPADEGDDAVDILLDGALIGRVLGVPDLSASDIELVPADALQAA